MVGFQHNGGHVPFALKAELQAKIRAAVKDIETAVDMPEDVAKLCWSCCCDPSKISEKDFEAALVANPKRAGVLLIGLLENVKGDDSLKEELRAATKTLDAVVLGDDK